MKYHLYDKLLGGTFIWDTLDEGAKDSRGLYKLSDKDRDTFAEMQDKGETIRSYHGGEMTYKII